MPLPPHLEPQRRQRARLGHWSGAGEWAYTWSKLLRQNNHFSQPGRQIMLREPGIAFESPALAPRVADQDDPFAGALAISHGNDGVPPCGVNCLGAINDTCIRHIKGVR